jgi:hypothetical protein
MAITTALCTSFKGELLGGTHDLDTHTLKMALIKPSMSGTYDKTTTNYSDVTGNSDEATGSNYSAGGNNLDSVTISTDASSGRAFVDIADEVFSNVTTSARGCIIYNSSASNKAIAVIDFGGTITATAGDLTVQFPAIGSGGATAIIRLDPPS